MFINAGQERFVELTARKPPMDGRSPPLDPAQPRHRAPQGHRSVAIQRQLQFARINDEHFDRGRAWRRRRHHHHGRYRR
jgi:hypothetical protein